MIIKDKALRKRFDEVSKQLARNAELREFYNYLQENESFFSRMNNIDEFREDILKSYIKASEDLYNDWVRKYEAALERGKQIEAEAAKHRSQWEEVIAIFNERFFVPFLLHVKNRTEIMLGDARVIDLGFTYTDGGESASIDKDDLLTVLSNGEKKALYILNVLFEIETRKKAKQETLVIVDDLADSFDYQNKCAIIHYLKDISEDGLFKQIIMTHNFDFLRTLEGRVARYVNCLMASKSDEGVSLIQATGIRNVFANDWKGKFFSDSKKKIASICFLRNLVEMTTGEEDPKFLKLTSMLHWRYDSATISVGELDDIFNLICQKSGSSKDATKLIAELIDEEANSCLAGGPGLRLENKIVLAMAIRIAAERFIIRKINDPAFVAAITANQTATLIDKFKEQFGKEAGSIKTLDRVALMTPENIHVNSFMYEPIIDMSDEHLKRLYNEVKALP
jgi:hypothetical protein